MNEKTKRFEQACNDAFMRYVEHARTFLQGGTFVTTADGRRMPIDQDFLQQVQSFCEGGNRSSNDPIVGKWQVGAVLIAHMVATKTGEPAKYTCSPRIQQVFEQYVLRAQPDSFTLDELPEHLKPVKPPVNEG